MKKGFLQGAVILSGAGILVKVLGALYRIPLARILGGEGMGLYQMAYPIYTSILAISTAGVPVAISILVAEKLAKGDNQGAYRIFRISLTMLTLTGLISSFLVFSNAKFLAEKVLGEPRAFFAIVAISPAIFFTAVVSAFRGYFQGYQEMLPTAVSQVVEQLIRVITVLTGSVILLPHGLELAAGGATFGAVTGGVAALLVLLVFYKIHSNSNFFQLKGSMKTRDSTLAIILRIFKIAFPLSLGGLVMPLMQAVDALFVPMGLQAAGLSPARATELFGQFTGMAGSLINLPSIITISLAVSLVPAVSGALALKKLRLAERRISASNRLALLLCLPAGAGLGILATPISLMLYDIAEVGIPLRFLAPGVLFLGLYQTTAGALQGLNKTAYPVINLMIGLIVKSILNYKLTAIPALNIKGSAIATVAAFFVAFSLNYLLLKVKFAMKFRLLKTSVIPLVATGIMVVGTKNIYEIFYYRLSNSFATLGSIMSGTIIYFFSLLMLGGLGEDDIVLIPRIGQKIAEVLKKLSILR
ncbi:MAG: putative polysaccharide biosynthesis protein [Zhaonellaceae bacterium]|jgi:stage V sporulation protein B|nr:polysaccharide biosynthesis protein [Clostridia bacterium]